jgi:hypothetical protein
LQQCGQQHNQPSTQHARIARTFLKYAAVLLLFREWLRVAVTFAHQRARDCPQQMCEHKLQRFTVGSSLSRHVLTMCSFGVAHTI